MPIYEYQCPKCKTIISKFNHSFDSISNEVKCVKKDCNGLANRKYSVPNVHIFKPYYNVMAGEWFESKKDAKEKCKRKYLELED